MITKVFFLITSGLFLLSNFSNADEKRPAAERPISIAVSKSELKKLAILEKSRAEVSRNSAKRQLAQALMNKKAGKKL